MEIGTKVRLLEDYLRFPKDEIVTCVRVASDGIHNFKSRCNVEHHMKPHRYELIEEPFKIGEIYEFSDDDGIKYKRKLVALKNDVLDYVTCSNNFDLNKIDMRFSCSIYKNIHHIKVENPRIKEIESLISDLSRELQTIKNNNYV